jgi:squalene-hopene/tetraprenyl-beta-curcumene cyclase
VPENGVESTANMQPLPTGEDVPNPDQSKRKLLKRVAFCLGLAGSLCVLVLVVWTGVRVRANSSAALGTYRGSWSASAAAGYLDNREAWWDSWPAAQRSEGTFCLSCHTAMPYALARPGLRTALGETKLTPAENQILGSIEKRVAEWDKMDFYYSDPAHAMPSRATESILNALILARYSGEQPQLAPVASRAFDEAWALQETSGENAGGWEWQDFHEAPWEAPESAYQGAAMMEIALGLMPATYTSDKSTQDHVEQLRQYLLGHYAAQPVFNQLYVLWASAGVPGLLNSSQRADLIAKVATLQHADGGWSLPSMDAQKAIKPLAYELFKRASNADESDGIATGLAVLALEKAGVAPSDPTIKRGLLWLEAHQYQDGNWWATSLNGFHDPTSDTGRFMSDAATGYAVLALEQAMEEKSAVLNREEMAPATAKANPPSQVAGSTPHSARPPL